MLKSYLKKIYENANQGDAREESYYPILADLLNEYAKSEGKQNIHVTILPKKTESGNPDFRIWDGKQQIVGYIEAKSPTIEYLDQIEETEQLKRYLHTFPNLILTNFFEFRLYRNGQLIDKAQIARPYVIHKLKTIPPVEKEKDFCNLLEKFFSFTFPKVYDAKALAIELAKRTRFLKDEVIAQELEAEEKKGKGNILGFYKVFREHLISGLAKEDFADLYSQTITYGLFAARTRTENGFNRKLAYDKIPKTIGILRDVFKFISLEDLPQQMEWIIDDISEVLAVTDVYKILDEYFNKHKGKDPIVHFYETFLAEYDPKTREKRGVYYTPEPVVSYIVRSLHHILKEYFNKKDGFANQSVTVLDPAAGTLTFLAEAAKLAVEEFTSKYGEGKKTGFIKEHILKNFYAFELMMAPYAIGHLKMSFLLEEWGCGLQGDDRFKLYLTNTLEMEELSQTELPGMASLSEESHLAGKVKKEQPVLVILGNPPYSGHSTNVGDWISNEIKTYYQVDGKPLGEKNPKWLQDDYVKFIRFAQWKIDAAGEGVLGFITNHSYLDNPTFRGMRQSLMQSFDEIYILDLHGNSLKKEKCPDGSKDENVFDIQQGVAIAIFIKKKAAAPFKGAASNAGIKPAATSIYHADLWGLRDDKYQWLNKHDITKTKWKKIKPKSEFYLFIPRDEGLLKQYETYPKITDVFPVNSVGIVTSRDNFAIDFDKNALKRRIAQFRDKKLPDEIIQQTYGLKDKSNWKLKDAREGIIKDDDWEKAITKILYRPFDEQWVFYHDAVIERSRKEVMQHMMQENLGICVGRAGQVVGLEKPWNIVFCSNCIEDYNLFYRGGNVNFPLYIYQQKDKPKKRSFGSMLMLFEPQAEYMAKKTNLSPALVERLTKEFKKTPTPEQIFYYIYAILYSNIYRTKYAEFLKIDFPRLPFTSDYKLFKKMAEYGEKLVGLHLLKGAEIDIPVAKFQGKGNDKVEKLKYEKGKLHINKDQYFEGISPEVWEYQIGGYQVLDKWLKDRKDRMLSLDDIKHYCQIVTSIAETIETQKEIDKIYQKVEIR
ncbi:MAG: N-6 DNA methylase [Deltaproteobacteria bacterium]|nr:N-6 DNA methylase [Deltaproteobacteria bacterium]